MIRIGIIAFPGTNNEVESLRAVRRAGMQPVPLKWNDDQKMIRSCDGYFIPGGFSYEDRGRSGMVAARDPVMDILREEATRGKVIIGHCNGAQILVESGLVPFANGVQMSLAHNAIKGESDEWISPGFINEWIWITPGCDADRCATSNWAGMLQIPIAHGEGRFTTNDPQVIEALKKNNQIAFRYCDASGKISDDPSVTPNGATYAIAGICNPQGNVVALMPHPERTAAADAYFSSMRTWIEQKKSYAGKINAMQPATPPLPTNHQPLSTEIFIDTIITNNEERTVERAAKRIDPNVTLKQYRYIGLSKENANEVLSSISIFNPNKEIAYVRTTKGFAKFNADAKKLEPVDPLFTSSALLRCNVPETSEFGKTGVCYVVSHVADDVLMSQDMLAIFGNPHASTIEKINA